MAIKFGNNDVTNIVFNSNNVKKVIKDSVIVWEKPFTLTLDIGTGVNYTCYRYSSNEPTATTGSSATLTNGSIVYNEDVIYFSASVQSGYTNLVVNTSGYISLVDNYGTITGDCTIQARATASSGSWHTEFSGDSEEYITPDGSYHEVALTGLGSIPSQATSVRVSGSIINFDDSSQTVANQTIFTEFTLTSGQWNYVAQLQDAGGSSELIVYWTGTNIQAVIRGTCYYPYIHIGQITKIEAYY